MSKYTYTFINTYKEELSDPNTYTFKEILFGLRNEYLQVTKQLQQIKKYLLLKENNIEDVTFSLAKDCESGVQSILCTLTERQSTLKKILYKLVKYLDIYPENKFDSIIETDSGFKFSNNHQLLNSELEGEFSKTILDVYNNEFVKKMESVFYGTGYGFVPFLSILPQDIHATEAHHLSIEYQPNQGDYLQVKCHNEKISPELLNATLNMTFPKRRIPEYYQNIIESSESIKKPIDIIGDINGSKKVNLEIIEEPKKLILKKI